MRNEPGQHFLLKSKSKTLKLKDVFKLSDEQAFDVFKSLRWKSTDGVPVCVHCGTVDSHWVLATRQFKCKSCKRKFSVTSGTIFQDRKLPLQDYLGAIAIITNGVKGYSMLQLSRDLGVQYKTAFVLSHKIREALMIHKNNFQMTGEIEIDVTYAGGKVKPANEKKDRVDRRLAENQSGKKRAVVSLSQRGTKGSKRTLTFVAKSENQRDINAIVKRYVAKRTIINADESSAYDILHANYKMKRVNHSINYVDPKTKASVNLTESFFSRFKRAYYGQHHHFSVEYLPFYANEIAYREDNRRKDNGFICYDILGKSLNSPVSSRMCGYWQRGLN
ncbi:MAG: IS1595 family transposase [Spirochaetota bacterium]|nr:IS1595 family transposase [Spirochaetota bacterium]